MLRLLKLFNGPIIFFAGITFLTTNSTQAVPSARSAGQDIFSKLEESVYQVLTAPAAESPKSSYGTGFIIDAGQQILATNFHVISDLVKERKQKLFILDRKTQRRIPAQVLAVDILSDLALVKVDEKLPGRPLTLRAERPRNGERSYSLGLPEDLTMSIIEGVYNGEKGFEFYSKVVLSTPLNSGMSGGPTVDLHGQVIGVNVATARGANSLSFSVPQRFLQALIDKSKFSDANSREVANLPPASAPKPFSEESVLPRWKDELKSQLEMAQGKLFSEFFLKTPDPSLKMVETPSWALGFFRHKDLNCWSDSNRSEEKSVQSFRESCFISDSSAFQVPQGVGTMSVTLIENSKFKENEKFKYSEIGSGVQLDRHLPPAAHFIEEVCDHNLIKNQHGLILSVNYCFSPFREFPGLYNYDLQVRSYDEDRKNYFELQSELRGFSSENIKKISDKFLNSLKRKRS